VEAAGAGAGAVPPADGAHRAASKATVGVMPHAAASASAACDAVAPPVTYLSKALRAVVIPLQKHLEIGACAELGSGRHM